MDIGLRIKFGNVAASRTIRAQRLARRLALASAYRVEALDEAVDT
jgi:hypothetical protein